MRNAGGSDPIVSLYLLVFWSVVIAALIMCHQANAYELLQPNKVILEGEYYDKLRDPYIPEEDNWTYGTALTTQFTLFGDRPQGYRFFFDPTLSFRSTDQQVRSGALYYELGGEIIRNRGIRLFRRHLSEHVFEHAREDRSYRVNDSYVMQIVWDLK